MNCKKGIFLFVLTLILSVSKAQYKLEVGVAAGGTNYLGEIGGDEKEARHLSPADLRFTHTSYSFGGYVRYKLMPFMAVKSGINYLSISASDASSANYGRRGRNLNFVNNIIELPALLNIYFLQVSNAGGYRGRNDFKVYTIAGASVFFHNPKAELGGTKIALRPLKTEGQVTPYSPISYGFPLGLGAFLTINRTIRIGIEACFTQTLTDYLDDVSTVYADPSVLGSEIAASLANRSAEYTDDPAYLAQYAPGQKRGDEKHKDSYMYTMLTASYVIKGKSDFYKAKYGSKFGIFGGNKVRRTRAKF